LASSHVHPPVSTSSDARGHRRVANGLTRSASVDLVVGIHIAPAFGAGTVQREAGLVLSNVSQPASFRRSRPLTRSSRCGCLAPEPIRLEALRPRCGSLPLPERSFASEKDVSDVTHRLEPRPARRSGEGAANERSALSVFFVSISRRARASTFGTVFQAIPHVWFPASLPRRAHWARRVDRVPARSCRGLPAHDVHSCVELGELGPLPAASVRRRRALSVLR
jgi:hypothetical protein